MGYSICPIATVHAPLDQVWGLLSNPDRYASWWDATTPWTFSISPEGPATPGQNIIARTKALGKEWYVLIQVEDVDTARHTLQLTTDFPLGITVHNHIVCTALDATSCRVSFG